MVQKEAKLQETKPSLLEIGSLGLIWILIGLTPGPLPEIAPLAHKGNPWPDMGPCLPEMGPLGLIWAPLLDLTRCPVT